MPSGKLDKWFDTFDNFGSDTPLPGFYVKMILENINKMNNPFAKWRR